MNTMHMNNIRTKAENILKDNLHPFNEYKTEDIKDLIHELHVHQIELELSNEELRNAQAESEATSRKYFDLYDLAPVGYFTLTPHGKIIEINLTGARLLETERKFLIGNYFYYYLDHEFKHVFDLYCQNAIKKKNQLTCELKLKRKNNDLCYCLLECMADYNTQGEIEQFRGILTNITDLKLTEKALKYSENKYRSLVEGSVTGIWQITPEGYTEYINPEMCDLIEINHPDDLKNVTYHSFFSLKDIDLMVDAYIKSPKGKRSNHEVEIIGKKGTKRHVIFSGAPIFSTEGRLNSLIVSFTDITDRKKIETELQKTAQHITAHVDNSPLAVIEFNPQFQIIRWSKEAEKMFGWSFEEINGLSISEMTWVYEEDKKKFFKKFNHLFKGFQTRSLNQIRNYKKNGTILHCEWYNSAIYDSNDNLISILSLVLDITERIVSEKLLIKAKASAETANNSKSMFLANMSHEIRTPITGISGIVDMAMTMNTNSDIQNLLKLIKSSTISLSTIINDILDFSKIEAQKMELFYEDIDIYSLIEDIWKTFLFKADQKHISLLLDINPNLPKYIHGDTTRISQVLRNLISNAIKFTSKGHVTIKAKLIDNENGLLRILFSVEDTGIGIVKNRMSKLFEPFEQIDNSYSKQYEGTGLGLAISKKIVKLWNGDLFVESQEGKGSTFYFTLPYKEASETHSQPLIDPESTITEKTKKSFKILLAEDEQVIKLSMVYFLKNEGHQVTAVSNGLAVIKSLKNEHFDVIIMDIQMPGVDGIEATRLIRNSQSEKFNPNIPIIGLTAYAMKGDKERFIEAGMNECFSKPADCHSILNCINKVLTSENNHFEQKKTPKDISPVENDIENINQAMKQLENDKELSNELFDEIINNIQEEMTGLKICISDNNSEAIIQSASQLTGILFSIPIKSTSLVSKMLEISARKYDHDSCHELFNDLEKRINRIVEYIKTQKIQSELEKSL